MANTLERVLLLTAILVYAFLSKQIFNTVYYNSKIVIDELFHIPQGILYCNLNFTHWDNKITTLPGLYLISTAFTRIPILKCDDYNLRLTNLVASTFNIYLFWRISQRIDGRKLKNIVQSLNLTLLPPLYFFSHLYYTDVLSVTFILIFIKIMLDYESNFPLLIAGFLAILMRQTNVVWIAMVFGELILELLVKSYYITLETSKIRRNVNYNNFKSKLNKQLFNVYEIYNAFIFHFKNCFVTYFKYIGRNNWFRILVNVIILISFLVFVFVNGSIVVGDKSAHEASIHLPQLLYFLLFYGFFGLPFVLRKFKSTLRLITSNFCIYYLGSMALVLVVNYNTVTHPYLLADNRHYTFYIWNRWFGKYEFAKFATIPIYVFLLASVYDNLRSRNGACFFIPFLVGVFLTLALQSMIEIRYFLLPFLVLRLRFESPSWQIVLFEFMWFLIVNIKTFEIFLEKQIFWTDFPEAQRLIW